MVCSINKGVSALRRALPGILEDGENALTVLARECFAQSLEQLWVLDEPLLAL